MRRLILAAAFAVAVVGPAVGQDMTGQKIEEVVAKRFAPKLKEDGLKAVSLDPITWADSGKPATAGAGLAQALAGSLTKNGIGLTAGSAAVVGGTLARITDEKSDPPAPALKLVLRLEVNGKPACEASLLILMEGVIRVDPVDVVIPPQATAEERVEILTKARDASPTPPAPGESVKWNPDSTVGLELLLAKTADVQQAREGKKGEEQVCKLFAARELDTKGRVKTAAGESCRIRLVNKNPFAIAGELRVAGVDWSEFAGTDGELATVEDKEKAKERLLVVVPANGSVVIRGWYRTDATSLTFDVTQLPACAAGRQADAGVVSFAYAACWKKGEKSAPGEEDATARLSDQQIKPGGVQADKFERVERVVGKPRGMVKLEYGEFKE